MEQNNLQGRATFLCKCDCGNVSVHQGRILLNNKPHKSCGCWRDENRTRYKHPLLYVVWLGIKYRCYNKSSGAYKNYGGRGIKVCNEWLSGFMPFLRWSLANGYKEGLELDRVDNDGNYEPLNCRYITKKLNRQNTRHCKINMETANEIRKSERPVKDLGSTYKLCNSTIYRIKNNKLWA